MKKTYQNLDTIMYPSPETPLTTFLATQIRNILLKLSNAWAQTPIDHVHHTREAV